jgi:hypothetical protein
MKVLAGICCLASLLTLSVGAGAGPVGGPPGQTGVFTHLTPQPFVPAVLPAVLPSASRVASPPANPIGTLIDPPGLLPAPPSGPAPAPAPGTSGEPTRSPPEFDRTFFVQSPPVVPGEDQQASGDLHRLPTCR